MAKTMLKPCPICKSQKLKMVYYAPPATENPDLWDWDENGYFPLIWFKRIECANCGATVPNLVMSVDDAIDYWNKIKDDKTGSRYVLQRLTEDPLTATEEYKEEKK